MENNFINKLAFVNASKYRKKVLMSLDNTYKTPSVISKEISLRLNHVSSSLRQLNEIKLVECINKDFKKGRIYKSTEEGQKIIDKFKKY
ncbi:hypothetical protein [Methanobrevibacter curvatus]|uniref:ArnR1-like winged helix-turn-helix domain-containing protein n=1 Tax=Methanobrevibacter curvatus TaxID=49547 RepID=A0A162F9Y4_9EURY|nr:hypothetical protein [Methanobrevibacter curvatus]KZX10055.1 hypothetical protein MBCUR_19420 [Methanobrevibacter curvatus]